MTADAFAAAASWAAETTGTFARPTDGKRAESAKASDRPSFRKRTREPELAGMRACPLLFRRTRSRRPFAMPPRAQAAKKLLVAGVAFARRTRWPRSPRATFSHTLGGCAPFLRTARETSGPRDCL